MLIPSHAPTKSHGPMAGRQIVVDAAAPLGQVALVPVQVWDAKQFAPVWQTAVAAMKPLGGHAILVGEHTSATSHVVPVAIGRQVTVDATVAESAAQTPSLPPVLLARHEEQFVPVVW